MEKTGLLVATILDKRTHDLGSCQPVIPGAGSVVLSPLSPRPVLKVKACQRV